MIHIASIEKLLAERAKFAKPVVIIPTMGALHEGHLSLLKQGRKIVGEKGTVVCSVFVNPIQFDKKDDLINYPRTLERDLSVCEDAGVDVVFSPEAAKMFHADASVVVGESLLSTTLCGASRKGHFDGVCTIVLKLANLVQPQSMIFGEKDFQQVAVVKRMVRDLNVPVSIEVGETVREEGGLALSSRNERLSEKGRKDASVIFKTLKAVAQALESGELAPEGCISFFEKELSKVKTVTRLDYVELVHDETMQQVDNSYRGRAVLGVAIFFEQVRLIDHISVDMSQA